MNGEVFKRLKKKIKDLKGLEHPIQPSDGIWSAYGHSESDRAEQGSLLRGRLSESSSGSSRQE